MLYLVRQISMYTDRVSSCLILTVVLMNCLLHAYFHTSHSFGLTQGVDFRESMQTREFTSMDHTHRNYFRTPHS